MLLACCVDVFVEDRFKAKENLQRCGKSSLIWSRFLYRHSRYVLRPFETFVGVINKRRMSPTPCTQAIKLWTNGREISRQTSAKQTNVQTKARQPNNQIVENQYARQREICKINFKNWRLQFTFSRICRIGYFTLLFCKERQRCEQRIITHARTAIVIVTVVLDMKLAYLTP